MIYVLAEVVKNTKNAVEEIKKQINKRNARLQRKSEAI